jgi:aminoglycoside phosphotransferase (APT) family kinase protein
VASASVLSRLITPPSCLTSPAWDGPPLWLHADLQPANVLTADGTFCGVIDFGDLRAGAASTGAV